MKHRKYRTIAIYAIAVILLSVTFFLLLNNFATVRKFISGILDVFGPFAYALVIAYLANPLMKLLERKVLRFKPGTRIFRIRRPISVTLTFLILLTVVTLFFWLVAPQIIQSFKDLESQLNSYMLTVQTFVTTLIANLTALGEEHEWMAFLMNAEKLQSYITDTLTTVTSTLQSTLNSILKYGGRFVIELKNLLIGLIASIYLLLAKERLLAKVKRFLAAFMGRRHYLNLIYLMRYTDKTVGGFLIGKIIDSFIIGVLTFVVMQIAGMPFAPLISVVIGVTNIIPFFGPFIGAIPCAFIILIADPSMTFWFILMIFIIQQLDGNVIGPKILGSSTGMTSLSVLVAITIAGGLFGFAGMIFGVPAAAVLCALTRQLTDKRLKNKNMPTDLSYYETDPPPRDFSKQTVILDSGEPVEGETVKKQSFLDHGEDSDETV